MEVQASPPAEEISVKELAPYDFKLTHKTHQQAVFFDEVITRASTHPDFAQFQDDPAEIQKSQSLFLLAESFQMPSLNSVEMGTSQDVSITAEQLWAHLSPKNHSLAEDAWMENIEIRKCMIDILLNKMSQEARQAGDVKQQKIIREARELLRLPNLDFLSPFYIGTSTAAVQGIEKAAGKFLSLQRLKEKGIARRSGEGMDGGANRIDDDTISVTSLFEVGDAYSDLNTDIYYRTPAKVEASLAKSTELKAYWEDVLSKPEAVYGGHYEARTRLTRAKESITLYLSQLRMLQSEQEIDTRQPIPLVFGLKDIQIVRPENEDTGNTMHAYRTEGEIDIKQRLAHLYVPVDFLQEGKDWLAKLGIESGKVVCLDSVRLIRDIDPIWRSVREEQHAFVKTIRRTHALVA